MTGMRINIENLNRTSRKSIKAWALDGLVKNMKDLRDRSARGDSAAIEEFFDLYRFDDSENWDDGMKGGA